jgi:hypothetical protein
VLAGPQVPFIVVDAEQASARPTFAMTCIVDLAQFRSTRNVNGIASG